jgi:hypothetical protein
MGSTDKEHGERVREFFRIYPDYRLCRTLAENIREEQVTYAEALRQISLKLEATRQNREQIEEHLDRRCLISQGRTLRIKDLGLRHMPGLSDDALVEVLDFYSKHPYAHGRCKRSRWLPAWIRSFPLRFIIAQARSRGLKMDYAELFDLLRLL